MNIPPLAAREFPSGRQLPPGPVTRRSTCPIKFCQVNEQEKISTDVSAVMKQPFFYINKSDTSEQVMGSILILYILLDKIQIHVTHSVVG